MPHTRGGRLHVRRELAPPDEAANRPASAASPPAVTARLLSALLCGLLLPLIACDDVLGGPTPDPVAAVIVTPDSLRLPLTDTAHFRAEVRSESGEVLEREVAWSSGAIGIAVVDEAGVAEAVGAGAASILAAVDGVEGRAGVRVPTPDGTVGVAGGQVEDPDQGTRLDVPPDALPGPVPITILALADSVEDAVAGARYVPASGRRLAPRSLALDPPGTLVVAFDSSALDPDTPANLLRLHERTDEEWRRVEETEVDTQEEVVRGEVAGAGVYGLVAVENQAPSARIDDPADGAVLMLRDTLTLTGSAQDPEDGALTGERLAWISDRDGALGEGAEIRTPLSSLGTHVLALVATDLNGAADTAAVEVTIEGPPEATIERPGPGDTLTTGASTTFEGSATDPEEGEIAGDRLVWRSDVDGELGRGTRLVTAGLTEGAHVVSLTATDTSGASDADSVNVVVRPGGALAGSVVREQDGAGLDSVEVVLTRAGGTDTTRTRTGPDGGWTAAGLAPGDYQATVAPATLPVFGTLAGDGSLDVAVTGGDTTDIDPFRFRAPEVAVRTVVSPDTGAVGDGAIVRVEVDPSAIPQGVSVAALTVSWDPAVGAFDALDADASDLELCVANEDRVDEGFLGVSCVSGDAVTAAPLVVAAFTVTAESAGSVTFDPEVVELETLDPETGRAEKLHHYVIFPISRGAWTVR